MIEAEILPTAKSSRSTKRTMPTHIVQLFGASAHLGVAQQMHARTNLGELSGERECQG